MKKTGYLFFVKYLLFVITAIVLLILLSSYLNKKSEMGEQGLGLPNKPRTDDAPPSLPSDEDKEDLPAPPDSEDSGGLPLFR